MSAELEEKSISFSSHFFLHFSQHLSRRFHSLDGHLEKSDSGIWINGLDYGGMYHVTPHIPELNDSIRTKCEEESPLCGLPWILPVDYLFRLVLLRQKCSLSLTLLCLFLNLSILENGWLLELKQAVSIQWPKFNVTLVEWKYPLVQFCWVMSVALGN